MSRQRRQTQQTYYIFSDESGMPVGGNDTYFIQASLLTTRPDLLMTRIPRILSDTKRYQKPRLNAKKHMVHAGHDIKNRAGHEIIKRVLAEISNIDTPYVCISAFKKPKQALPMKTSNILREKLIMRNIMQIIWESGLQQKNRPEHIQVAIENFDGVRIETLRQGICNQISMPPEQITMESKSNSRIGRGLQVADCLAFSWHKGMNHDDQQFVEIVPEHIVFSEILSWADDDFFVVSEK
ncbi:MAG: hypothetical protein AAF639_07840 [Chloroflexota bacterium]